MIRAHKAAHLSRASERPPANTATAYIRWSEMRAAQIAVPADGARRHQGAPYWPRYFPNALRAALTVQVAWLVTVFYVNCGVVAAVDNATRCERWLPHALESRLPRFIQLGAEPLQRWVHVPDLTAVSGAPHGLQTWLWQIGIALANALLWAFGVTIVLSTFHRLVAGPSD